MSAAETTVTRGSVDGSNGQAAPSTTIRSRTPFSADPLWFKDAIIYELHVKAFCDSNGDGIGDFPGLISKLDYLQDLGINCVWLLPFYPSPQKDDGYDIADYRGVHPDYGTLRDFRQFVREAHRRGIRVITELVINHTSNQHAWFQASRRAAPGSSVRDFYVWSDTDKKFPKARIIFEDSEPSNWTWDPVAKAYYWHRFFHHQPDLNFDNPHVLRAVLTIFKYWLQMGVDGMRLDAVPYLVEREDTDCENLPETHAVLKELRRQLNQNYPECMLLAEANQWPDDVRPYFGDGDECHMAFHFPLMPRIFMAMRQEDRHPITEIMRQTPPIPDNCQWALFLRNHDELTLEKVTDIERDYMHREYAADPRSRLNLGIRRRLAPLMEHSRRRLELLTSLLFSLPGSPVIYYGDEIGMGDNLYLGDRNGVRTPMQWSIDRNAGFSRADFAKLYSAPIMDPVDGYQAVNVESQQRDPSSLLNWTKQMIALRKRFSVFGRGSMKFLHPRNRKILAYVRRNEDSVIIVVANLSRFAQPVELDLSEFRGAVPVELIGGAEFPTISDLPYFLALGPHAFYWFRLRRTDADDRSTIRDLYPDSTVLQIEADGDALFDRKNLKLLERDLLPAYVRQQSWFIGRDELVVRGTRIVDWVRWLHCSTRNYLTIVDVEFSEGRSETYFVPLAITMFPQADTIRQSSPNSIVATVSVGQSEALLHDAMIDDEFCTSVWKAIAGSDNLTTLHGQIRTVSAMMDADSKPKDDQPITVRRTENTYTNCCVQLGQKLMLKMYRRIEEGKTPDWEIGEFLSARGLFHRIPRTAGGIEYVKKGSQPTTLALLQNYIPHQRNAWDYTVESVQGYLERVLTVGQEIDLSQLTLESCLKSVSNEMQLPVNETFGSYLQSAELLGERMGELHRALAADTNVADFSPEPLTTEDLTRWSRESLGLTQDVWANMDRSRGRLGESVLEQVYELFSQRSRVLRVFNEVTKLKTDATKIRIHGDCQLNEVLWSENDFVFLDFEGEPARSMSERRAKQSPLKDVAVMLRSFEYAAFEGLFKFTVHRPEDLERLEPWVHFWKDCVGTTFLRAYCESADSASFMPKEREQLHALLKYFLLDRALYELLHELKHRPNWVQVPLRGVLSTLHGELKIPDSYPTRSNSIEQEPEQ